MIMSERGKSEAEELADATCNAAGGLVGDATGAWVTTIIFLMSPAVEQVARAFATPKTFGQLLITSGLSGPMFMRSISAPLVFSIASLTIRGARPIGAAVISLGVFINATQVNTLSDYDARNWR